MYGFAVDVTKIAGSTKELKKVVSKIDEEVNKFDLEIKLNKIKFMIMGATEKNKEN